MGHLKNLQAMRGVAALMVLLVHLSVLRRDHFDWPISIPKYLGIFGPAGVDLFFVISGVVITTVAIDAAKNISRSAVELAWEFAVKRCARIYPVYWLALVVVLLAQDWVPLLPQIRHPLWQISLLLNQQNYLVRAAWTLVYEMYFYASMTFMILIAPRHIFRSVMIWSAVSAAAVIWAMAYRPDMTFWVPFSPLLGEFVIGAIVGQFLRSGFYRYGLAALALGILWFVAAGEIGFQLFSWKLPSVYRVICFGPSSALIIYGVLALEKRRGWVFPRIWQSLGDASYSLYIWHHPLLLAIMAFYAWAGIYAFVPLWLLVFPMLAVPIGWALVSYRYIERPAQKFLHGVLLPARTPLPASAALPS